MAEDDIYGSRKKYERFKENLNAFLQPPKEKEKNRKKYYCKNEDNLQYFRQLFTCFAARDMSFIRRLRVLQTMRFIVNAMTKDLVECKRDDINQLMAFMHDTYNSPGSKQTFIKDLKFIWKTLFPEKDEKGRLDDTIVPYAVRHISGKIDKSRQKLRQDKLTWEEFERIVNYFSNEPRIQAFLTLSLESLSRPQELLYVRLGNVELHNNYARIFISEHGKEGTGILQCIDSYPYLIKWLNQHPLKKDKQAFLFINTGTTNNCKQLKPKNVNKMIRKACKELEINKPITCYSLKRNGVTIRRLRGESDMEIQHAARWTSTKQLKTYDLSSQDEAFKLALEKRGLIRPEQRTKEVLRTKSCPFCNEVVGFGEIICPKCRHTVDRGAILSEKEKDEQLQQLRMLAENKANERERMKQELKQEILQQILREKESYVQQAL
jgi:integrase